MPDAHLLTIVSLVLGVLGSLYLSYDLLGRPDGFLRRLLVAIPASLLFAILYQTLNIQTGYVIERTLSDALQVLLPPYGVAVMAAVIGFYPYFLSPTLRNPRNMDEMQKYQVSIAQTPLPAIVLSGLAGLIFATVANALVFQVLFVVTQLPQALGADARIGLIVGGITGFIVSLLSLVASIQVHNSPLLQGDEVRISVPSCMMGLFGCLFTLAGLAVGVYFLIHYPLPTLVFVVSSLMIFGLIGLLQRWAMNLPERQLGSIGAFLTFAAFGLQLFLEVVK